MPSFQDSAVLVILALLLFGPKKLPVLARQLGKLMADFRRASNEFRTQMEEELRIAEQTERQKQVAAIEAAKPATPAENSSSEPAPATETQPDGQSGDTPDTAAAYDDPYANQSYSHESAAESAPEAAEVPPEAVPEADPQPIATSGELSIMPPSTGLPIANSAPAETAAAPAHESELETETLHG